MSPWIVGGLLVTGLALFKTTRKRVLGTAAVFFLAQLMFPFAYAYQEYYYYACTVFLLAAIGFIFDGLLDSRVPRWISLLGIAALMGVQLNTYRHSYYGDQSLERDGGFNYTGVLRDFTPKDSIIIVAGNDWCPIIPYYSERRALMIRNGLERDADYLHRAMDDLAGEKVSAIVLVGPQRGNQALLKLLAQRFDIDDAAPAMSEEFTDIYLSRSCIDEVREHVRSGRQRYPRITLHARASELKPGPAPIAITDELSRKSFGFVSPAPFRGSFKYGYTAMDVEGIQATLASPACDLWLHAPGDASQITWEFGIVPDAYLHEGDKTDGVEFLVAGETPDGRRRGIFRRVLDPVNRTRDRGPQREVIAYKPLPGENLIFSNRPNLSESYDWSYWVRIEVK